MKLFNKEQLNHEIMLKKLIVFFLLVLLIILFSQKIDLNSSDLGRHIENGKMVWQDKSVLFTNFYSYTENTHSFVNHHWLSGVIYYVVYSLGGFKLLSIFNVILVLFTFFLVFNYSRKKAGFLFSSLLSIPVLFLLSDRVDIRPEVFSCLLFFLVWLIIYKVENKKNYKYLYFLLPIFLLWVNLHIFFFLGLGLLGAKWLAVFIDSFIKRKSEFKRRLIYAWERSKVWFKWLAVSSIITLVNPNTIKGFLYPFNILKDYGYDIAENKSIFFLEDLMFNPRFFFFKLLLLLLIIAWVAHFVFNRRYKWFELFVSCFITITALLFSRNIAFFSLVTLLTISIILFEVIIFIQEKTKKRKQLFSLMGLWLVLLVLFIAIVFFVFNHQAFNNRYLKHPLGWGLEQGDNLSAKFFKDNKLSGPIFNNYDIGSALIFWLYPQEKVFVDNRPEAYGKHFFQDIYIPMQNKEDVWKKMSQKYKINIIYFSHRDSTSWSKDFLHSRLIDPNWVLIYFDQYSVILIKNTEENEEIITKNKIDFWSFRRKVRELSKKLSFRDKLALADLSISNNQLDLADEIYKQCLIKYSDNPELLSSIAYLYAGYHNKVDDFRAIKYFNKAIKNGLRLPGIYNKIGLLYWDLEDYQQAESNWLKAKRIDRDNKEAIDYLEQIKQLRLSGRLK